MEHIDVLLIHCIDICPRLYEHIDKLWVAVVARIMQRSKSSIQILTIPEVLLILKHFFLRQYVELGAFGDFGRSVDPFTDDDLIVARHLVFEVTLVALIEDEEVRQIVG